MNIRAKLEVLLSLALVALLVVSGIQRQRSRAAQARIALMVDTLKAHFDTSRAIALAAKDSAAILGDSLRAVQRQVVQANQKRDALDKALGVERVGTAKLTAEVKRLRETSTSETDVSTDTTDGTRAAHFDVRQVPYTARFDVSLPAQGKGKLTADISIDPAPIGLRVGCGAAVDGIRSATAVASGPAWLTLLLDRVEQSPEVCNVSRGTDGRGWFRKLVDRVGVSAGYGVQETGGTLRVGPSLIAGVKLWP